MQATLRKIFSMAAIGAAVLGTVSSAEAIQAITNPNFCSRSAINNSNRGWKFTVSQNVYITQVGFSSPIIGGFSDNHHIRLYTEAGDLLFQKNLPQSTDTSNDWGWVTLDTPYYLTTGTYVIAASEPDGSGSDTMRVGCDRTLSSELTYIDAVRANSATTFPQNVQSGDDFMADPNFRYELWTPTPTPMDSPTNTPTPGGPTDTPTSVPTDTPTPEATDTPTPEATDTPTLEPTDTPTPEATDTPTAEATDTPTVGVSPTLTPTPTPESVPVNTPAGIGLLMVLFTMMLVARTALPAPRR